MNTQLPNALVEEMKITQLGFEGELPPPEEQDTEFYERLYDTDSEALQAFDDGATVDTPDGFGIIDDIITEGSVDDMDATEDNPVYAVVVEDESVGVGFYREGDLSDGSVDDLPGPENPTDDLEALADIHNAIEDTEALQDGFFEWPESWEESEQPARVIALKAWAGMGGSFTGCTREMRGSLTGSPDRFCADFKDRLYGTEQWRGGWGNEALAGQSGTEPFANNPVVPTGLEEVTPAWLIRWAEWVAAGEPPIPEDEALRQWNPALHPRGPDGKFVERSFDVPSGVDLDTIQNGDPGALMEFISDMGARSDVNEVLSNEDVVVDGIPDDVNNVSDLKAYVRETDAEERIPPSATVGDTGTAEMFEEEFTGEESVELLSTEGTPTERRELTDRKQQGPEIPANLFKQQQVPEGEEILVTDGDSRVARTVQGYSRPSGKEHPVIDVGGITVDPDEVDSIHRAAPRAKAEVDLEWPDRYSERKRTIQAAMQQITAKGQDDAANRTIREDGGRKVPEIDDSTFESAVDRIASVLADTDQDTAERAVARLQSIGDDLSRAHSGDRPGQNRPRSYIDISEGESQSTIKHELGHAVAQSAGFGQVDASASARMDYYPGGGDDVELSEDGDPVGGGGIQFSDDPVEQYTVGYSNDDIAEANDVDPDSMEANSVGRSEWESQVREEIPKSVPDLDARNFTNVGDEYLLEASAGDMIRTEGPNGFGRHLSITGIDDDPIGVAERDVTAVAKDGTTYEFEVEDRFGEVSVSSKTITDDRDAESTIFRVAGKRQSTPDGWSESEPTIPDPDDVLGGEAPESSQEAMRDFVAAANKAWFRGNLAANRVDNDMARDFNIQSAYSSTSAHEVIAQMVETTHAASDKQREVQNTARRLVNNNPELIESYRHIANIPDPMKSSINTELERADAEFRLE